MHKTNSVKLSLKEKSKKKEFEDIISLEGEVYLITSFFNKRERKNYLFAQSVSEKLEISSDLTLLATVEKKESAQKQSLIVRAMLKTFETKTTIPYHFETSQDNSKFMSFHNSLRLGSTDTQISFQIFDQNLNLVYEKEDDFKNGGSYVFIKKHKLAKNGDVYLLGVESNKDLNICSSLAFIAYTNSGKDKQEMNLGLEDKEISAVNMQIAENGNALIYGTYTTSWGLLATGAFSFELDVKEGKIVNQHEKDLSFDPIAIADKVKKEKGSLKKVASRIETSEPYGVRLFAKDLINKKDGSTCLIVEKEYQSYQKQYTRMQSTHAVTMTYFRHYDDLFLINFTKNGEIEWTAELPKKQKVIRGKETFGSYAAGIMNDEIVVLYNEHKDLFKEEDKEKQAKLVYNGIRSNLAVANINATGNVHKNTLSTIKGHDSLLNSAVIEQGENALFISCERKKSSRMGKME